MWIPLQINIQAARAEMEITQVHVIGSSEGEKKTEWGRERREEQRGERKERWRKPWLQDEDGGGDDAQRGPQRGQGWENEQQDVR